MDSVQLHLVHRIPGRMRLALPPDAPAREIEGVAELLRQQTGVRTVTPNTLTRRLLVLHDREADLSAFIAPEPEPEPEVEAPAVGLAPGVRLKSPAHRALREDLRSSLPAGGLLAAAFAKNALLGGPGRFLLLDYVAVAATGYSVLSHGRKEDLSERLMHPDTIASILLLVATQPAQLLTAGMVMCVLNIGDSIADHRRQESGNGSADEHPAGGSLVSAVAKAASRLPGVGDRLSAMSPLLRDQPA